jgi:hypothetical protein
MSPKEKQVAVGGFLVLAALVLVQFVIRPTNKESQEHKPSSPTAIRPCKTFAP